MDQLVAFDEFVDAMRQNDWDVEASLDDFDELVAGVDPAVIAEYNDYLEENCRSGSE